jgi:hypothetical protein
MHIPHFILYLDAGFPALMRGEDFESNFRDLLEDEATRTRSGFQHASKGMMDPGAVAPRPVPGCSSAVSFNSNANQIRLMVAMLAHLSDDYLLYQPIDALFRLAREEKMADTRSTKGLDSRLHQNYLISVYNPVSISGQDNRSNILHPARFLPGPGVPAQNLWLEARKIWGQDGVEAIGNFDFKTLGCSG